MRLLAYTDSAGYSGAEVVFGDVVVALASDFPGALSVAFPRTNRALAEALAGSCKTVIDVPAHPPRRSPLGLWNPRRGRTVRRLIRSADPDLVLVNLPGGEYGATPLVWSARPHALAGIVHLHQTLRARGEPLGRLRDALLRPAFKRLEHAFVISPSGEGEFAAAWGVPAERCSTLPLLRRRPQPVDRAQACSALGLPLEQPVVGIVGRIAMRQKGHDLLVEAAALLRQSRPEVVFAVVGAGPDEQRLRALARQRGVADALLFTGTADSPGLALSGLDAIAMPSRFEGLPLTALEALELGVLGVATAVDGLRDVWPQRWLVPPDDSVELARRLDAVLALDDAQRRAAVAEGRERLARVVTDDLGPTVASLVRDLATARQGA